MKKRIFLVISLIALMLCMLTIVASAEEFTVNYNDGKAIETTNEDGVITLRDTIISNVNANKTFYGWYTKEGDMYKPGETITLTKDTNLYEAYGYPGTNKSFPLSGDNQWDWPFIQLQENIVLDAKMSPPWGGCATVDLNGFTITTSAQHAVNEQRSGIRFVGEGSVIHTGTGNFFNASSHGYGDGSQYLLIGKNVTVTTNGTLFNYTNDTNSVIPIHIFGNVICNKLFHITKLEHNLDVQINPDRLEVTGDVLMTVGSYNGDAAKVSINIFGGNIVLSSSATELNYWHNNSTADNASRCYITITQGAFNCGDDAIKTFVPDGYKTTVTEIGGVKYTNVVKSTDCSHEYELSGSVEADCVTFASQTYTCKKCQDTYTVTLGNYADHKWELIEDIEATVSSVGMRTYQCSVCEKIRTEKYYVDIRNELITVVVKTADGEKEVSVKVSDVFDLEEVRENEFKLKDLKAFDAYAVADIVAITVPLGIVDINFSSNNSTLKKLVIDDGATLNITSFSKCSALTHIEIKAAEVTFKNGCSNNVIQSIKSEVEGADVIFEGNVFKDKKTVAELVLSAKSSYTFGGNSFRNTGIKEFIAPDYSNVTFKMDPAFYGCTLLEYIYIGRGIEILGSKPFDYCQKVQKIVLMDVVSIPQEYTFCVENAGEKPVEVYIHSNTISLANNTFYQCHGIIIYTNAPITNSAVFNSCNATNKGGVDYPAYTIVYGAPHKYTRGYIAPTCTKDGVNGYLTDCPCGENLSGSVTLQTFEGVLTNNQTYTEQIYNSFVVPATGHTEGSVANIEYINGYMQNGLKENICGVCGEKYIEDTPSADILYSFLGYSMPEDGRLEITMGFMINVSAIEKYEDLTGKTLVYGMALALESKLEGKAPFEAGVNRRDVVNKQISRDYCGVDFKVSGFTEASLDLAVVMTLYVRETASGATTVVYLQEIQKDKPNGVSINSLNA